MTLNGRGASLLSHQIGDPPGWQDWTAALRAAHHVLLSHGWAVPVLRRNSPGAEVGIVLNFEHVQPATSSAADFHAARRQDGYFNRWFLDPVYGRYYPADMVADYISGGYLPHGMDFVQEGDRRTMGVQNDFLGVNYYTRDVIRQGPDNMPQPVDVPDVERTEMGWEIYPQGLYHLLNRLHFEYQIPKLYVTENGCSFSDGPDASGRVTDQRWLNYLRITRRRTRHAERRTACRYLSGLMDNSRGQRFCSAWHRLRDYETQQRYPKDSAVVQGRHRHNGFSLDD